MKALHVFPLFGPDLINGSERHEYLLSEKLAQLGTEVDVLTSRSKNAPQTSAFSSAWPHEYTAQPPADGNGMRILRFPATFSIAPRAGRLISRSILSRWQLEEQRYGLMVKGSRNVVDYYHRRAVERPRFYDFLMVLSRGPYSARLMGHLISAIRKYDVILVGFTPFALSWQVIAAARLFKKPVVLLALFHPDDIYHHFKPIYWCFNNADAILAQTPYSLRLFRRLFPASYPVEAGVGVDLNEIGSPSVSGMRFRRQHRLQDAKIALLVGRKEHFKRYDLAIAAVDRLKDNRVRLVMIGCDVDQRPISSPRVIYLGEMARADVLDAYDACDLLVLPSESESFGWVLLEAWARCKPVIGNRSCAPVATVIDHGEDGYLCGGAPEMAERMNELVSQPELARRFGARPGSKKSPDVIPGMSSDGESSIFTMTWPAADLARTRARLSCDEGASRFPAVYAAFHKRL